MRSYIVALSWALLALCSLSIGQTQTPNPLSNGGFEELQPNGFPVDWEPVGQTVEVTTKAHAGSRALRFLRTKETKAAETGLNRRWRAHSGEQGAMLDRLKGGITFWYQAVRAQNTKLTVQVIPMSSKPIEDTGEARAVFTIPAEHVGDGQWHQGWLKYDFTGNPKVKWLHVGARLLGDEGELLLDDFAWVERVGPLLRLTKLTLTEDKQKPGERGTLTATVENVGDALAANATASVTLPTYLRTEGTAQRALPAMPPDEKAEVSWTVTGRRDKTGVIRVTAAVGAASSSMSLPLRAHLSVVQLRATPAVVLPGEAVSLECFVRNEGNAFAPPVVAEVVSSSLQVEPKRMTLPTVAPAETARLVFRLPTMSGLIFGQVEMEVSGANLQKVRVATTLRGAMAHPRPPSLKGVYAEVNQTGAVIGNERVRLVFPDNHPAPNQSSYSVGQLEVWQGKKWVTAGWVACQPAMSLNRGFDLAGVWSAAASGQGDIRSLTLRSGVQVGGKTAQLEQTFTVKSDEQVIRLTTRLRGEEVLSLHRWDALTLWAGERSFAGNKSEAIFPGLEWLEKEEWSSSDLDIAKDHKDRLRYVPHPNKITIPAMGVFHDGVCVGLLWDARQKWDGVHDRPSAVFASPNYFEGHNNHLMGLFLPSVPEWVKENERQAATPYELKPNQPLTLTAYIYADGEAKDALAVVDKWFEIFGVPEPMPKPRGSWEREVAFSMRGYLDSALWDAKEEMWRASIGGPSLMTGLSRQPDFTFDVAMGALLSGDANIRRRCAERLARLRQLGVAPVADDLGFLSFPDVSSSSVRVEDQISALVARATSLIRQQGEDGAWRFDADRKDMGVFKGMDYHELGPDEAAELGTCARHAYEVLRAARLTGDKDLFAAGARALQFMERFKVPRAAQVWEVPVHTPDVLAAADAVDAYLEAYYFTGSPEHLARAIHWARKGLPFLYVWNEDQFPFMRYASIPVFGATWYQGSWFGTPVQWNGLRYAYAVLKLAEELEGREGEVRVKRGKIEENKISPYFHSAFWRKIGEGVTVSALCQQSTDEKDVALWPDNISAINGNKAGWIFAPRMILKNVYKLMGRDEEPRTVVAKMQGETQIHLSASATIADVKAQGDRLSFSVTFPSGLAGFVLLSGVSRPARVLVDGKAAESRYEEARAFLTIRVTKDGKSSVQVEGVQPRSVSILPKIAKDIRFEFDDAAHGFLPAHDIVDLRTESGLLKGAATGVDPYMERYAMDVDGSAVKTIRVRMKVSAGGGAQFYWITQQSPGWAEDKAVHFPITADNQFHEYALNVGKHPLWNGQRITAIRLDPTGGAPGAAFEVDWIRGE